MLGFPQKERRQICWIFLKKDIHAEYIEVITYGSKLG